MKGNIDLTIKKFKFLFLLIFEFWWRPLIFFLIILILAILNSQLNIKYLGGPIFFLYNISEIVLVISIIFQFIRAEFFGGCVTSIVLLITGIVSIMIVMIDGDHWADNLVIPKDIVISEPQNENSRDTVSCNDVDLILYNGMQSGIYKFDFCYGKIENGEIYLKAYEITGETILSEDRLARSTYRYISNTSNEIKRFRGYGDFTIYEGDWGKFYAARFEVWFKPSNKGDERKLMEKNFKIEGWMH